ncbi:MAG: ATP-grasp domain-containing protein [Lachnospiraceae bacterium]|nr:ATP-grasp domain-containing protein [Lachnospiraceae bacterium]
MFFILQKEDRFNFDDIQFAIMESLLKSFKHQHEYVLMQESDLCSEDDSFNGLERRLKDSSEFPDEYQKAIAIGEVSFVGKVLKIFHGIDNENAIEVPPCLREYRYLKRKYSIVPVWDIPREGRYFIKDATQQKVFSYKGELENFVYDEMFEPRTNEYDLSLRFDYEHLYQISEVVNVLAEYRAYILEGQLETVSHFSGDAYLLPDMELLKDAIRTYNKQPDCPKSYSIDLMITPEGTAITEVHNFMCLGLYNVNWDEKLLFAFRDGWNYVLNYNTPQTEYSNFE